MPTGYTAEIKDGTTFEQFAMSCARGFGALIMMRDLPSDAPIPERFEPSDYHSKALAKARITLSDLERLTPSECEALADGAYDETEKRRLESLQENNNQLAAYRSMLDSALTWISPSPDHDGLKKFMIEQIRESIRFDDNTEWLSKPTPRLTWKDWLEEKKAITLKDIDYHKQKHADEVGRTEQRNEWLRLLRESLAVKS